MRLKTFISIVLFCLCSISYATASSPLSPGRYDIHNASVVHANVQTSRLRDDVAFLADSICTGRSTGTIGGMEAAFWISGRFSKAGLLKMGPDYIRSFRMQDGRAGHNVVGFLPASHKYSRDRYIIVGAHYDGLGVRGGNMYPCADSNAAGVAALLNLVEMFRIWSTIGHSMGGNIIFVAFDSKELSMAGSKALMDEIIAGGFCDPISGKPVTKSKIKLMVNMDQIGSSLEPLRKDCPDYLIMLGNDRLPKDKRNVLRTCNLYYDDCGMDIGYDYYGSKNFTKLFYRLSDQKAFAEAGIPAVFFTSGITENTNKLSDTADAVDYDILRRRIILIWHFIERMNR